LKKARRELDAPDATLEVRLTNPAHSLVSKKLPLVAPLSFRLNNSRPFKFWLRRSA
jgi:hypothetical protein